MAIDLNTAPYFDDFDTTKGFNRILFKPGVAVQARELTQLQTILQDQITNLASWQFQEGAIITGCARNVSKIPFIKIAGTAPIENLDIYVGDIVKGTLSGIEARIIAVESWGPDTGVTDQPNLNTFYLEYLSMGGQTNQDFSNSLGLTETLTHFHKTEYMVVQSTTFNGESAGDRTGISFKVNNYSPTDETYYGHARKMFLDPGIIYARGHFIRTENISTICSRYGPGNTKRVIGFLIDETVVIAAEDNTLLDPASGSYNYNAPGADRLKFEVSLAVYDLASSDIPDNFYQYAILDEDNELEYADLIVDDLAEMRKILARRTHDESGHYVVRGLKVSVQEHLNDSDGNGGRYYAETDPNYIQGTVIGDDELLTVVVDPGKAYVQGNEIEITTPYTFEVEKALDTISDYDVDLTMSTGNYVIGHTLTGDMDFSGYTAVDLHADGMTGASLGTAKLKYIKFHSSSGVNSGPIGTGSSFNIGGQGTGAGTKYRFYLYDINMTGNWKDVKAITVLGDNTTGALITPDFTQNISSISASGTTVTATFFDDHDLQVGDTISIRKVYPLEYNGSYQITATSANDQTLSTKQIKYSATFAPPSGNVTETGYATNNVGPALKETALNRAVWKTPYPAMKRIGDFANNNDQADIEYTFRGSGVLSSGTTSTVSFSTSGGGRFETSYSTDQIKSDLIAIAATAVTVDVNGNSLGYLPNQIIDLTASDVSITTSNAQQTINITFNNVIGGDIILYANVREDNVAPASKTANEKQITVIDGDSISGSYNWVNLGNPVTLGLPDVYRLRSIKAYRDNGGLIDAGSEIDVTTDFIFDNGQRDNLYKHSSIAKKPESTFSLSANGYRYLAVEYDYFSHGSGYFFNISSYPSNDVLPLQWIPVYKTGTQEIYLRDAVDFRPVVDTIVTPTAREAYDAILQTNVIRSISVTAQEALTANRDNPEFTDSVSRTVVFPVPDSLFTADMEHYLSKAITITMPPSGRIYAIENSGIIGEVPPIAPANTMTLGTIKLQPFPSLTARPAIVANRTDMALSLRPVDNRRFTMKDLRAINKRVSNLEYYVSLNSLEKEAEAMFLPDGNGLNRFKNGILVDNFNSNKVARIGSQEFKASLDTISSTTCNPSYKKDNIILDYNPTGSNVQKWGTTNSFGQVTATYTPHVEYIAQVQASKTRNAVGEIVFDYVGKMSVSPDKDNWVDNNLVNLPAITDTSAYDEKTDGLTDGETIWGDWETTNVDVNVSRKSEWGGPWWVNGRWNRRKITTTTTTTKDQVRTGETLQINEITDRDTKIENIDLKFATYMRSQSLVLDIWGLKPGSEIFFKMDGLDASQWAYNLFGAGGDYGKTINDNGTLRHYAGELPGTWDGNWWGVLTIPAETVETGIKEIRVSDDRFHRPQFETSYAVGSFSSTGMINTIEQREYIVKDAVVVRTPVTEERQLVETETDIRYAHDPLAQSFRIEDQAQGADAGVFISSVDLWFRTIPTSGNNGITLQIRNMVNGYPGPIVYGEKYVRRQNLRITPENSNGRFTFTNRHNRFTFEYPVYLPAGAEYCIVPMPKNNDRNYNVWVAELGEPSINSITSFGEPGDLSDPIGVRISEQPHSGILFSSANNTTWTAHQDEDMMFRINRIRFNTGNFTARFQVSNSDYIRLENVSTDDPNGTFWDAHDTFPPFPRATAIQSLADENGLTSVDPLFGTPSDQSGKIYSLSVDISGTGNGLYSSSDTITVNNSGTNGTGAAFELVVNGAGNPVFVKCTNAGSGYTSAPSITVTPVNSSASGITFTPRFNQGSSLITYARKGKSGGLQRSYGVFDIITGYFTQNRIRIPTVTGSFKEGEIIEGSVSGTTAILVHIDPDGYMRIANVSGDWDISATPDTITGQSSGASGVLDTSFVEYSDILHNYPSATNPRYQYNRTAQIASIDDRPYHEVATNCRPITPPDTKITVNALLTDYGATSPQSIVTQYQQLSLNTLEPCATKKDVLSYSNRIRRGPTNQWSTTPDFVFDVVLNTTNPYVSPILDLAAFDSMVLLNVFNNDYTNEEEPRGGNAKAKYVSKTVRLAKDQDAEDLNVFLNAYDPETTSLKAYAKFKNQDHNVLFDDQRWLELTLVDEPAEKLTGIQREYKYEMPRVEFTLDGNGDPVHSQEGYDEVNLTYRKTVGYLTSVNFNTGVGNRTTPNLVDHRIVVTGGNGSGAVVLVNTDSNGDVIGSDGVTLGQGRVVDGGLGYSSSDPTDPTNPLVFTQTNGETGLSVASSTVELVDYRSYAEFAVKFLMLAPEHGSVYPVLHDYRALALQT